MFLAGSISLVLGTRNSIRGSDIIFLSLFQRLFGCVRASGLGLSREGPGHSCGDDMGKGTCNADEDTTRTRSLREGWARVLDRILRPPVGILFDGGVSKHGRFPCWHGDIDTHPPSASVVISLVLHIRVFQQLSVLRVVS